MTREAFGEFSKMVLYFCNHSKTKVYSNRLELMIVTYLYRVSASVEAIGYKVDSEGIALLDYEEALVKLYNTGFIQLEHNCYGTAIVAKVKLVSTVYANYDVKLLNALLAMDADELWFHKSLMMSQHYS